jgi:hypothetical protein
VSISAVSASSPNAAFISATPANSLATIAPNATTLQLTTPLNPATADRPTSAVQPVTTLQTATPPISPATAPVAAPVPPPLAQPPLIQPAPSVTQSAVATSTTIAQTYGFAPSLIVPLAQVLTYQPIYANPSQVSGVTKIALISRTSEHPRHLFDQLA